MTHFPRQILDLPKYQGRFEAFKLAAQGCDVLFASYPAGSSIEAHSHDTDNIGMITQGELILTMNGQTERFGVGDWYHTCPPGWNMRRGLRRRLRRLNFGLWWSEGVL